MINTYAVRVYNASYEELGATTLDRAMVLVEIQGRAEVVAVDESRIIRTMGGREMFLPKIIRLLKMAKVPFYMGDEFFSKTGVMRRDGQKCGYCGVTASQGATLTHDHIMPKSRGGGDTWDNAITACVKCNGRKSNMTPDEAGMPLRFHPASGEWTPQRLYFRSDKPRRKRKNP